MLLISVNKKAAYDGSVAVDPNHQQYYVSHLMKWQAIQYLIDIDVKYYELGEVSESSSYLRQPSKKNYGISFFKDGWSRGKMKKTIVYEKYFSKSALNEFCNKKIHELNNFFEI
jgi:lipid II:glycine glycyltransferase (peptidoglycan interpeptide bridge formation enzyme)